MPSSGSLAPPMLALPCAAVEELGRGRGDERDRSQVFRTVVEVTPGCMLLAMPGRGASRFLLLSPVKSFDAESAQARTTEHHLWVRVPGKPDSDQDRMSLEPVSQAPTERRKVTGSTAPPL